MAKMQIHGYQATRVFEINGGIHNMYYHVYWVAKRQGVAKCSFLGDQGISAPDHSVNSIPSW
jgi:hypothetical protein